VKDAYWFTHDSNAKDDPKCILMIEDIGPEGYGIFWILIETLRDQPDYKYPLSLLPALARRHNTNPDTVSKVVREYGLFEVEEEIFYSPSLMGRMKPLAIQRENASKAGKISAERRKKIKQELKGNSTVVEQSLNEVPTGEQHSTVQYSTLKNSKVELSEDEEAFINVLKEIPLYPVDLLKDKAMFDKLEIKYPQLDLLEAVEEWKMYKEGVPLTKGSNARSQFNTSCDKCIEWNKCLRPIPINPWKDISS
jgi:hypothetical protein